MAEEAVPVGDPVVVDTNILFSALLRADSRFSEVLLRSPRAFFVCESVLVELFRHKERIVRASRLSSADIERVLHTLLRRLHVQREDDITTMNWGLAHELCRDVDETDTPHVAAALQINGWLWSGDRRLISGLSERGFARLFDPSR